MVVSKRWTIKRLFVGAPKLEDFEIKEETLPQIADGEFLVEAIVWSVDPYNRVAASRSKAGDQMVGYQLGKVLQSKCSEYPAETVVLTTSGWRTHTIINPRSSDILVKKIPEEILKQNSSTYFAGILGMPGATAYFGLIERLQPKEGQTLVVNAAAGAVGAVVGQIGKLLGLKVIGYAGSDKKVAYLKEIGYDYAFNYKTSNLDATLKEAAPNGVDLFFDNVGYEFGVTVINHMSYGGRVLQCGAVSGYNATETKSVAFPYMSIIFNAITIYGFLVRDYWSSYESFLRKMSGWISEGKVKVKETKYDGFQRMPQALIDVLSGAAEGKAVIVP